MLNVKNVAIRILVGIVILVTFSACETNKQGKVMSAEDVPEQPQVLPDVVDESPEPPVISREEFGSSDFIPESIPSPTVPETPKLPEPELPDLPEVEPEVVFDPTPPTRVLPTLPLEFPKGNRGPASDYVPESPPEPVLAARKVAEPITTADIEPEEEPEELPPDPEVPEEEIVDSQLEHVFFDFDQYDIRDDAVDVLEKNAEILNGVYKDSDVLIEGHCDERGTTDYNVELGKRRAQAVKDYLVELGVEGSRIRIVSYGKEKPFCRESKPECWQKNRRGHFVLQQ